MPDSQSPTSVPVTVILGMLAAVIAMALLFMRAPAATPLVEAGSQAATPAPSATPPPAATEPTKLEGVKFSKEMVWIPGGTFAMGMEGEFNDTKPIHKVTVDGFWMDKTEVTNEQFAQFVKDTGYITIAERKPDPKDFPGVPEDKLVPGAIVFSPPKDPVALEDHTQWWQYIPGASWRQPDGPGSSIAGREKHPAVHICWYDADAFAKWAGKRLPSEAEWEFAARGGLHQKRYTWGEELTPGKKWMANIWQGQFPAQNSEEDGSRGVGAVASYAPNGFGLYDMAGNVWEWCADWYRPDYYEKSPEKNPAGPADSFDPLEPGMPKKVQRGGSYLCSDLYCIRYLPGARGKGAVDTGLSHTGFRCAK